MHGSKLYQFRATLAGAGCRLNEMHSVKTEENAITECYVINECHEYVCGIDNEAEWRRRFFEINGASGVRVSLVKVIIMSSVVILIFILKAL